VVRIHAKSTSYPLKIHMNYYVASADVGDMDYLIGGGCYHFDLPDTVRSEGVIAHPWGTSSTEK
jgi:hypothetical protein